MPHLALMPFFPVSDFVCLDACSTEAARGSVNGGDMCSFMLAIASEQPVQRDLQEQLAVSSSQ